MTDRLLNRTAQGGAASAEPVLGRRGERAFVAAWLRAPHATSAVVLVRGLAGVGKSTLLQALRNDARDSGLAVVTVDGRSGQADSPPCLLADGKRLVCIDHADEMLNLQIWLHEQLWPGMITSPTLVLMAGRRPLAAALLPAAATFEVREWALGAPPTHSSATPVAAPADLSRWWLALPGDIVWSDELCALAYLRDANLDLLSRVCRRPLSLQAYWQLARSDIVHVDSYGLHVLDPADRLLRALLRTHAPLRATRWRRRAVAALLAEAGSGRAIAGTRATAQALRLVQEAAGAQGRASGANGQRMSAAEGASTAEGMSAGAALCWTAAAAVAIRDFIAGEEAAIGRLLAAARASDAADCWRDWSGRLTQLAQDGWQQAQEQQAQEQQAASAERAGSARAVVISDAVGDVLAVMLLERLPSEPLQVGWLIHGYALQPRPEEVTYDDLRLLLVAHLISQALTQASMYWVTGVPMATDDTLLSASEQFPGGCWLPADGMSAIAPPLGDCLPTAASGTRWVAWQLDAPQFTASLMEAGAPASAPQARNVASVGRRCRRAAILQKDAQQEARAGVQQGRHNSVNHPAAPLFGNLTEGDIRQLLAQLNRLPWLHQFAQERGLPVDGAGLRDRVLGLLITDSPPLPLGREHQRVLRVTYIDRPGTAIAIADRLAMSRSTYYRQLADAQKQMLAAMWMLADAP